MRWQWRISVGWGREYRFSPHQSRDWTSARIFVRRCHPEQCTRCVKQWKLRKAKFQKVNIYFMLIFKQKSWILFQIVKNYQNLAKNILYKKKCEKFGQKENGWSHKLETLHEDNLGPVLKNIARGTKDPEYQVHNLNHFSDWNLKFEIILTEKDHSSYVLNTLGPMCLWQCFSNFPTFFFLPCFQLYFNF